MDPATLQAQELSNHLVRFTVNKKPACRVEYDVQAAKELIASAKAQALKSLSKEVTLPGFRKGKAPDALILKNFPKEFDRAWQESIADLCFKECQTLAKTPLLSNDARVSFQMKSHSIDAAELTLSFETEPEIPSVDPKTFTPKEIKRPEVNQEKIDETIRQIRFFFAEWSPVSERPVQEGDFVILDVDVIENEPHTPLFSATRFEVGSKHMAQWMKDMVLGKNLHAQIEGVSGVDEDAEDKETFKPQKVRITIRAIEQGTLPDLDEDFLKKIGVESQEALHTTIEALLKKQSDEHVKEKLHEQVNEYLLEKYPFDLPPTLIEKEAQFRMRQLGQDANFQKYWQALSPEEKKKTLDSIFKQSEKAVRMFYLCRKIISDAKISISPEDLPKPASTALEILMDPDQMLNFHEHSEVRQAEALSKLVLEKAADYVVVHSQNG